MYSVTKNYDIDLYLSWKTWKNTHDTIYYKKSKLKTDIQFKYFCLKKCVARKSLERYI